VKSQREIVVLFIGADKMSTPTLWPWRKALRAFHCIRLHRPGTYVHSEIPKTRCIRKSFTMLKWHCSIWPPE